MVVEGGGHTMRDSALDGSMEKRTFAAPSMQYSGLVLASSEMPAAAMPVAMAPTSSESGRSRGSSARTDAGRFSLCVHTGGSGCSKAMQKTQGRILYGSLKQSHAPRANSITAGARMATAYAC